MSSGVDRTEAKGPPTGQWRGFKVTAFVIGAIGFVVLASLCISIIQFQIRIIDAKNQSKNFSLISLSQSVAMQKELENSVKNVQDSDDLLSSYEVHNTSYLSELSQFISLLCVNQTNDGDRLRCAGGISNALQSGASTQQYIYQVISIYAGIKSDQLPDTVKPV